MSQSHLKDGVQLVEALQAPHGLAFAAGEGVVAGWEVNGELVASSRQRPDWHSSVFLLTFNQRIHNLDGINFIVFSNICNCPSVPDVQEHLKPTTIDGTHPLTEDQPTHRFISFCFKDYSNVFLISLSLVSPSSPCTEQTFNNSPCTRKS